MMFCSYSTWSWSGWSAKISSGVGNSGPLSSLQHAPHPVAQRHRTTRFGFSGCCFLISISWLGGRSASSSGRTFLSLAGLALVFFLLGGSACPGKGWGWGLASPRRWPFFLLPPDGAPDEEERPAMAIGRRPGFLLAPAATADAAVAALAARSSSIFCFSKTLLIPSRLACLACLPRRSDNHWAQGQPKHYTLRATGRPRRAHLGKATFFCSRHTS